MDAKNTYAQHLREAKESAFNAWRKSGYRDKAAHARFVWCFETLGQISRTSLSNRHAAGIQL